MSKIIASIVAIDLTFTGGLGLCAIPRDWDGLDWSAIVALSRPSAGESGGALARLADEAVAFCEAHGATAVAVEAPLPHAFTATKLAALGGAIRSQVFRVLGLDSRLVSLSTARKLCFGQVPRFPKGHPFHGKTKQVLHQQLTAMGAPAAWDSDARDAFVIGNFVSSQLGGAFLALPPPPKAARKRKARKQAELFGGETRA